jgi:uncharacterized protein (TIGR00299 family) protein
MAETLQGQTLYLDCFAGIAGDMALGALLDLGVPEGHVRGVLARLPVRGWRLETERVKRGALVGMKARVIVEDGHGHGVAHDHDHDHHHDHHHHDHAHEHPHAHYREIRAMLEQHLDGDVRARSLAMFQRIAEVEARMHGVAVDDVMFHEVGAVDSIIDIVGTAAALSWLAPRRVVSRPVPLGRGSVKTAHGVLPVPAPATLELLRGAQVEAGGPEVELTTPTGACIVASSASAFGELPRMEVLAVGFGAGDRDLADRPNLLRVVVGRETAQPLDDLATETLAVVEANVDDMNPELMESVFGALFDAGAKDVWTTPIVMKKGRPAVLLSALCEPSARTGVQRAMLRESTSIGVRSYEVSRTALERRVVEVDTAYGKVAIKVSGRGDEVWNAAPEYEVCRTRAQAAGVPVKMVYQAAIAAFFARR